MPHAIWHRKSAEFLNTITVATATLTQHTTWQCADPKLSLGTLGGVTLLKGLVTSQNVRQSLGALLSLKNVGDKVPSDVGVPVLNEVLRGLRDGMDKTVGTSNVSDM